MKKYVFFITILMLFYEIDASQNGNPKTINMMVNHIEMTNMMESQIIDNTEMQQHDENPQPKNIKFQHVLNTQVCTICTDVPASEAAYTTKCNHVFCRDCLFEWLKTKQTCPNCRISLVQDEELTRRACELQWNTNNHQMSPRATENPIRGQRNEFRSSVRTNRVPVISRNLNILFHIFQWSVVSMLFYRVMNNSTHEYQAFVDIFGIILTVVSHCLFWFVQLESGTNFRESDLTMIMTYWIFRIPTFVLALVNLFHIEPLSMAMKLGSFIYELFITFFFSAFEILFRNRIN